MKTGGLKEEAVEALVAAVLAVNHYPLEKAWGLLPGLRASGLTDPSRVAESSIRDLTVALAAAGYDRGFLTEMMASRLKSLMQAIHGGQLTDLPEIVARRDEAQAGALLTSVKGIGPTVAKAVWMLLTS